MLYRLREGRESSYQAVPATINLGILRQDGKPCGKRFHPIGQALESIGQTRIGRRRGGRRCFGRFSRCFDVGEFIGKEQCSKESYPYFIALRNGEIGRVSVRDMGVT